MTLLQGLKDPCVAAGALGALLGLSVLLVHLPAAIYGGNAGDLAFGLADFLLVAAMIVLPAFVVITLALLQLAPRPRAVLAGALCAVGICMWLYGNFSLSDTLVLDGRQRDVNLASRLGWWELPIVAAGILAIGVFATRHARAFALFLGFLNLGLAAGTAWELLRDPRFTNPVGVEDSVKLFRLSTRGNVLVVLMDSLQSDVFDRVARADDGIRSALEGFTLYRDTSGVAPTTLLSLPAIHSGLPYTPGESLGAYYDRTIAKGSFLTRFAELGYEATLVNVIRGVCPARTSCVEPVNVVGSQAHELWKSSLRMLDFSLLRVAPFALKPYVYNEQRWLFSSRWQYSIFVDNIVHGNTLMERIASQANTDDGPPTVKFLHLMSTHAPFILREDCRSFTEDLLVPLPDAQVRCALRSFVSLLERLKKDGLYDRSTIALIADHGYALPNGYQHADAWGPWGELMGAANPVFLLKRPGARGHLSYSDEPLMIADTAAMMCDALPDCAPRSTGRRARASREFLWYRWEDIGWGRPELTADDIGRYTVSGPVWDRSSWRLTMALPGRHRLGNTLGFMPADERPELSPFEWSIPQDLGTWAEGHSATVAMDLGTVPVNDLDLVADAYAFLPPQHPSQRVRVLANGVEIGQWHFDATEPAGIRRARIPRALVTSRFVHVTFLLPDAVSPAALGLSTDPRVLSLGLRRLSVTPAGTGLAPRASEARAAAPVAVEGAAGAAPKPSASGTSDVPR